MILGIGFPNPIGWAIDKVTGFVGGAKNALIALAVAMNLQTIAAFFGLIGAAARLIWYLGVMTVTAIPKAIIAMGLYTPATTAAAVATTGLATATNAANAAALGWLGNLKAVLGVLGSIAAAAAFSLISACAKPFLTKKFLRFSHPSGL